MYNELKKRREELKKLEKVIRKALRSAPKGTLRITKAGKEYYHRTSPQDKAGTYIRKDNRVLARRLAQRDYDEALLESVVSEIDCLDKYIDLLMHDAPEDVYGHTSQYRRPLVESRFLTDEEYAEAWQSESYEGKQFSDLDTTCYLSQKNERMRSKSEVIIANTLSELGIPYKYEHPLYLTDGIACYPDFTILVVSRRQEIYLEHYGMMSSAEYRRVFFDKQILYAQNDIIQGVNYFMTFEDDMHPLNVYELRKLLITFC